ncbi:SIS domain-containing protein [Caproicibacter fermentans]|uniref:SIS domain-containing protein n=1 Tax=Caproicibacter fermentans TaxID=2576756 RepID=A0A7G8TC69_9FIRM|nr:SIS domain-containing protein [Caproicibacter fermentans]QNK41210.1 SIS domain-containing protein [Caproicibacter fermentans]
MKTNEVIRKVLAEHGEITEIYWAACGGSLIDLYPSHYLVNAESEKTFSGWYTAKEFTVTPPKKLEKHSMVIVCSHSGNTQEAMDAAVLAYEKGAAVVTLTDKTGSKVDDPRFITWVYPWGDHVPTAEVPLGICPALAAELIKAQESFPKYDALMDGLKKIDGIIEKAKSKVNKELGEKFADRCQENEFFYILGSGAAFSQTYGFAICSLMEMQRQNCCYLHSAEYFHGPFECTEKGVFYFLQMSSSQSRVMDERALSFLKTHTDRLMVLDAMEYGMGDIDAGVRAYLEPALFYAMNVELRAARGKRFNHSPEIRRYMGIENY